MEASDRDLDVLEALPDGVLLADADGRVEQANATALRLLEFTEAPAGRPLRELMALQDLDGNDWFDCVAPYTGLAIRRRLVEASWWTRSGSEVLVTGVLHRSPAGNVRSVALALRDSRSRERVNLARSDLVATVAHELRSPLTGVKGFTSTLLSKWDRLNDSQRQLMLRTVDADADRLTRLIAELLDVARIDSGRLSVRKEPVDLVSAVRRQLEPLSVPAGRNLAMAGDDAVKSWVDPDKFAQIVANLVENALRHGDGDVTVTLRATVDDGAELLVDDDGPGIPEEIRSRVFTKFWKHGRHGGSGLGLYIVGGLAAAHDGQVGVETSPSGGARMRVWLPHGRPAAVD